MACTFCDDEREMTVMGKDGPEVIKCWFCAPRNLNHPFHSPEIFEADRGIKRGDSNWHKQ